MRKDRSISAVVYAAIFLLILAVVPAAARWKPHPLAPAFSMMPEPPDVPVHSEAVIVDPKRPHAEVPPGLDLTVYPEPPPSAPEHDSSAGAEAGSGLPGTPLAGGPQASELPASTPAAVVPGTGPSGSPAPSKEPLTVREAVYRAPGTPAAPAEFKPIPVLNYHSVAVDPGNIVVIHPDKFREHMQYLHDNGYRTLTLNEFTDIFEGRAEAPAKAVLLTFDDGYTDNYETAMPVLKEFGFHATLFMSPGMVGQEGYIDWEQARELQKNGWDIQPHGMTHPSLPKLSAADQTREIVEARRLIEEKLGTAADIYCYPYGQYNRETLDILKNNGFRYAFTIEQGKTAPGQHPYKLTRIFVNGEEKLSALIYKLTKW